MALFKVKPQFRRRGGISYYGTASPLIAKYSVGASTSTESSAVFGGGANNDGYYRIL